MKNEAECLKTLSSSPGGNYSLRYDIENTDIHKLTASRIFNVPYNKVTDEQRRIAKTLNFKELYK